jgi:hypothetical protein
VPVPAVRAAKINTTYIIKILDLATTRRCGNDVAVAPVISGSRIIYYLGFVKLRLLDFLLNLLLFLL